MPYIITTPTTKTATATLAEARDEAFARMADAPRYSLADAARISVAIHDLDEAGGIIVLTDSTIAVRALSYEQLLGELGVKFIASPDSLASAIREYNARNGEALYS